MGPLSAHAHLEPAVHGFPGHECVECEYDNITGRPSDNRNGGLHSDCPGRRIHRRSGGRRETGEDHSDMGFGTGVGMYNLFKSTYLYLADQDSRGVQSVGGIVSPILHMTDTV